MEEKEKETSFELGTLYDVNKNLIQNSEKMLSQGILNSKKEEIKNFLKKTNNEYYMLLCHERRDYTLFNLGHETYDTYKEKYQKTVNVLIDECLQNRGEIRGIDITKDKQAIEVWISTEGDSYVYYFFPYDKGVIEIEKELLEDENE